MKVLFTGSLSMPRSQAQRMAEEAGAGIAASVSKKLSLLVVGDEPGSKLERRGHWEFGWWMKPPFLHC